MLVKTSIVCLLFSIYMIGFYYRKPHIPTKSTKIFQWLTMVEFLNVLFDLITIYTVNHRDTVPDILNLIAHIIYLMSILGFIFLLFLYMRSYLEVDIKFSKVIRWCHVLPFAASSAGILVLPITYVHGKTTDYSLGPKAYALYVSIVIYLVMLLYYCLRYWEKLDAEKRLAIILAVPIYVVIAIIQMLIPETLIVIVGGTLILLGLILSNENTEKYVDEKTALFNQYSFETVLEEFDFDRQKMIIAILCFCKTENNYDWKQDVLILQDIYRGIRQYRLQGYRIGENGVVFISNSVEKARTMAGRIKNAVENKYGEENIIIETRVLSGGDTETKHDCMRNAIAFCTETGSRFAYIDYLTHIYNRNAFERDIADIQKDSDGYYMIADLNDLKMVNDTIGHSAGDILLQEFAGLLSETVGEDGRVYRQGGDEFAILYYKDARQFIEELDRQCKIRNKAYNVPVSYAIGYCRLSDSDFLNTADSMMYADKRAIKQQRKDAAGRKK